MGLKNSKSSAEAAVLLGFDAPGKSNLFCSLKESIYGVRAMEYVEMNRTPGTKLIVERKMRFNWMHCDQDTSGLVHVMDDPTGGVWMKPNESSTRPWRKNA